jgi:hypothetical protein
MSRRSALAPNMTHSDDEIGIIEYETGLACTGFAEIGTDVPGRAILVPVFTKGEKPASFTAEAILDSDRSTQFDHLTIKEVKAIATATTPRNRQNVGAKRRRTAKGHTV